MAIALLTGGDEPSAQLQALENDPMAEYAPPGGRLVETDAQSEGQTTLGKPQLARHNRLFALDGKNPERALEDALAAAVAAGWTLEGQPLTGALGGTVGFGGKRLSTGRARLTVSLHTDARVLPDDVSPPALSIQLEHLSS